jgi:hypothetical protein
MIMIGKGKRVMQNFRSTNCKAVISVSVSRGSFLSGKPVVQVVRQNTAHNHPIGEDMWFTYAENRQVRDPRIISMVKQFIDAKSSLRKIHEYVRRESGQCYESWCV